MKNSIRHAFVFSVLFATCVGLAGAWGAERSHAMSDYFVYVGTYTGPKSQGIYAYRLAGSTGKLTPLGLAGEITNPAFLAVHPNHRFLYAVNEVAKYDGEKTGSVSAFSIDRKTAKLTLLNVVASGDPGPCHLTVDHTGKYLLVANYGVGSVAVFPILADGSLGKATAFLPHIGHGVDKKRQEAPHAHSIYVSPDNRFVVSADLGTDQIYVYRFDDTRGLLMPNQPAFALVPPGTGPRHFAFHPSAKFAYAIEEMGSSLTFFTYDAAHGVLDPQKTISTVPSDYKGYNDCAELLMHPSGKFLYGSNRGHDSIAVFAIDQASGKLTLVERVSSQGKWPRTLSFDPTGKWILCANHNSDNAVVFRVDGVTGKLTQVGPSVDVPYPFCVRFLPVP